MSSTTKTTGTPMRARNPTRTVLPVRSLISRPTVRRLSPEISTSSRPSPRAPSVSTIHPPIPAPAPPRLPATPELGYRDAAGARLPTRPRPAAPPTVPRALGGHLARQADRVASDGAAVVDDDVAVRGERVVLDVAVDDDGAVHHHDGRVGLARGPR